MIFGPSTFMQDYSGAPYRKPATETTLRECLPVMYQCESVKWYCFSENNILSTPVSQFFFDGSCHLIPISGYCHSSIDMSVLGKAKSWPDAIRKFGYPLPIDTARNNLFELMRGSCYTTFKNDDNNYGQINHIIEILKAFYVALKIAKNLSSGTSRVYSIVGVCEDKYLGPYPSIICQKDKAIEGTMWEKFKTSTWEEMFSIYVSPYFAPDTGYSEQVSLLGRIFGGLDKIPKIKKDIDLAHSQVEYFTEEEDALVMSQKLEREFSYFLTSMPRNMEDTLTDVLGSATLGEKFKKYLNKKMGVLQ